MIWGLAIRNFWLHRDRFRSIALSLSLGLAAVVVLLGVSRGMTDALNSKAAKYFGGDVVVSNLWGDRQISQRQLVVNVLKQKVGPREVTLRSEYFGGDAALFFRGQSIRQRKLVGIDWSADRSLFRSLDLSSGQIPTRLDGNEIVVSESTARRLPGLSVGSPVIAQFETDTGQNNTVKFRVAAIYRDTSFFGYASYVGLQTMNRMVGRPDDAVTGIGVMLPPGSNRKAMEEEVRKQLVPLTPTYSVIHNRGELDQAVGHPQDLRPNEVAVVSLAANLAEITSLLDALLAVAFGSVFAFLGIVVIGVGNTYRMIVVERTREMGTLRALGMTSGKLLRLILGEAAVLSVVSSLLGLLLGGLSLYLLTLPKLRENALWSLFLFHGHLKPGLPFEMILLSLTLLPAACWLGAYFPAWRAVRMRPVDALRYGQ